MDEFIEWLRENHNYTGDGSTFSIQSEYSSEEIEYLFEMFSEENGI